VRDGAWKGGTGPERPPSGPVTGGDPAATGSVVPIEFLEGPRWSEAHAQPDEIGSCGSIGGKTEPGAGTTQTGGREAGPESVIDAAAVPASWIGNDLARTTHGNMGGT
jgi:hypothetical protein